MVLGLGQSDGTRIKTDMSRTHHHHYHHHHYHQQKEYTHQSRSRSVSHQGNYKLETISPSSGTSLEDKYEFHRDGCPRSLKFCNDHPLDSVRQRLSIDRPRSADASLYSPTATLGLTNSKDSNLIHERCNGRVFWDSANCDSSYDDNALGSMRNSTRKRYLNPRSKTMGAFAREFDTKIKLSEKHGTVPHACGCNQCTGNPFLLDDSNCEYISQLQKSPVLYPTSASTATSRYAGSVSRSEDADDLIALLPNQRWNRYILLLFFWFKNELLTFDRRNIVAKRGAVFTLMVAGESGLGKSTDSSF